MADNSLTIAIPTYNRRDPVVALAQAVLDQLAPHDELLVCDDGSGDGTVEALGRLTGVRVEAGSQNQGMVRNWNACLETAKNPWVCLIHDDDRIAPAALD